MNLYLLQTFLRQGKSLPAKVLLFFVKNSDSRSLSQGIIVHESNPAKVMHRPPILQEMNLLRKYIVEEM